MAVNKGEWYIVTRRVLFLTLFLNLLVVVLKIGFGIIINSLAMIADGLHSLMDTASNIIGLIGLSIARKPADKDHPYGHRKFETLTTMVIAGLLLIISFEVIENTVRRFSDPATPDITTLAFGIMIFTLLVNQFVSSYEKKMGERYNAKILLADAAHTRSDVFVTISVIVGFFFIKAGYPIIDPFLALLIAAFIAYAGYRIISHSASVLTDASVLDEKRIAAVVRKVKGVKGLHKVRSRSVGTDIMVDLHILMDGSLTLRQSHKISKKTELLIKKSFPHIADVTIHVDPDDPKRNRIT